MTTRAVRRRLTCIVFGHAWYRSPYGSRTACTTCGKVG
jgi:hypothetical protein